MSQHIMDWLLTGGIFFMCLGATVAFAIYMSYCADPSRIDSNIVPKDLADKHVLPLLASIAISAMFVVLSLASATGILDTDERLAWWQFWLNFVCCTAASVVAGRAYFRLRQFAREVAEWPRQRSYQ